eukprot:2304925-Amphidinium_carterae.1
MEDRAPERATLASLQEQMERDFGTAEASAGSQNISTSTGSSSVLPHMQGADAAEVTHAYCEPVRTSGANRGIRVVPVTKSNWSVCNAFQLWYTTGCSFVVW